MPREEGEYFDLCSSPLSAAQETADIDCYPFTATAGEAAHIRVVDANADGFYPQVWLYNPDGTLNVTDGDGTTAELDCHSTSSVCQLNQTGTYRLVVADFCNNGTGGHKSLL